MSAGRLVFDKYDLTGAYHWRECDPASATFNPPLVARYLLAARRVAAADRLLDIGCGDGYLLHLVAPRVRSACGIEREPAGAALAARLLAARDNCAVLQGSCYALPFADGCFDRALMTDVIEHLEDPGAALREAARVLHPRGELILTTPKWRPDRRWDARHVREFRPEELRACLRPHFSQLELSYFWPLLWSRLYATRLGWRVIRALARRLPNPFLRHGGDPRGFGQILAVCRAPRP